MGAEQDMKPPVADERDFSKRLASYAAMHWAWPAIILLCWALRRFKDSDLWIQGVIFVSLGVVIVLGWKQVATDPYLRARWTILLIFVLFFVSVFLIPVLFIVLPFALIWFVVDLFFIAPRRP